jgi:hypothetical protein
VLRQHFVPSRCSSDYEALGVMRQQLLHTAAGIANQDFLRALDVRERHLEARCALSGSLISRLKGVATEYLAGDYRRYPLGGADAVKDLLVGTR